jgi:DNA-binding NarL/FixJ family response regulator
MQAPIHVLIADDHAHVREAICRVIRQTPDIQVVGEAWDGLQALQLIQELKPDLAILDISMPGLDGIDVAEQLHASHNPARVLILTGYASNGFAQLALEMEVAGYLLKEEAANCLVDVIYRIMSGERGLFSQKVVPFASKIQPLPEALPLCRVKNGPRPSVFGSASSKVV